MVTHRQIAKKLKFSRTSACEGRSNCGVMWGSGGDECAAFASLESV